MEEMLMRLSSDQRSKARRTSFSASEVFSGSVLVRMLSQRSRICVSRWRMSVPWLMDFFNSSMRVERSAQPCSNGVSTSLSPTSKPTPMAARMASARWRFSIFIAASVSPLEVQGKLQRRLAAHHVHFQAADLARRPQLVEHAEEGLVVARHARAGDDVLIVDLHGLRRDQALRGEGPRQP